MSGENCALEKEYPVFNKIRRLLFRRNGNPNIHWVELHTNATSKEARLNTLVDELATIQHSAQGKWAFKNNRKFLPNQRAQLVLQGDVYERDYNKEIVCHVHGNEAAKYIGNKMNISAADLKLIDWASIKDSNSGLSIK